MPSADKNPELLKAQYEVFSRQIPVMYSILLISTWSVASTFLDAAPQWLVVHIPIVFSLVCGVRVFGWWRSRRRTPSAEIARKALLRTNRFALIMAIVISVWSLSLAPYGSHDMQSSVAFFMAITGICVVVCLLHLRSAAFIVAIVIAVFFSVHFGFSGVPSFVAMTTNLGLATIALLMVVFVQSGHFASSIDTRTSLEAANRENFRMANLDSLTGLANRRQFFSKLDEVFAVAGSQGTRVAVGIVDLDGFKPINDLYGHVIGDQLLVAVGQRLLTIADKNTFVSRLGGDEFALLASGGLDDADLLEFGDRVCAALREPFILSGATVQISGSMGLAVFPELADSPGKLYERADYALYNGKRVKRGHAVLFSETQITEIEKNARIEQTLRAADLDVELEVHFQPIVDALSQKTVALEALARWHSPVLGDVPPKSFIPVAERAGLVSGLTRVLLQKALAAASRWPDPMRLSFNLSTHDISSDEGVARIMGIIHKSGFDPKRIDLEITETAMMYDFAQAKSAIETLKLFGCGIALDDFGTGFSSLSQLHSLPLTKIKIDRSFVSSLDTNPASL
ncbi:putative bifunctional diguanylate cyclase/phosphodiesterase [Devosia algicola]|uniref:putative bifunctional diguanylate cyclase/phosphodiesterase n=1 Tax=Devosia algicola TaxID=3026418 RepID=UPI002E1D08A4